MNENSFHEATFSAPAYFEWTAEQSAALESLRLFLNGPPGVFVLAGYAGTGKTTLVVEALRQQPGAICFTAPTHKAVGVLAGRGTVRGAQYATIHRLLGCKRQRINGDTRFLPDFSRAAWDGFDVIVCDEISMVGDTIWSWLMDAQVTWPRHVIMMGDPAQLPPVNDGDGTSPAFRQINAQLTEVMRSAGVVLNAASTIRQHLLAPVPVGVPLGTDDRGTVEHLERDAFVASAVRDFQAGVDAKILAWTNAAVDFTNALMRRKLYGDDVEAMPHTGELLVVTKTWSDGDESVMLHAEQELIVEYSVPTEHHGIPAWRVECEDVGVPLFCVQPTGRGLLKKILANFRHEARAGRQPWRKYYALEDAFVELRPGYATTVHKSQGSTFHTAYVIDRNLKTCPEPETRNMLRYVACSRASKRLVLS